MKENIKKMAPFLLTFFFFFFFFLILASRISDFLQKIIHPNIKCSEKGRSIHDGTSLIRDLIEYFNRNNLPRLIVSLDQTKAYDSITVSFTTPKADQQ